MNIFEGSRRIALIVAAGWLVFCGAVAKDGPDTAQITYQKDWPNTDLKARPATDYCGYPNAEGRVDMTEGGEVVARLSVCFKAQTSMGGTVLVPYALAPDGKVFLMQTNTSPEVRSYAERETARAVRSGKFNNEAKEAKRAKLFSFWWGMAKLAGGGLLAIWIATAVIGWVVRGFAGIPRGQDRKPKP